jgi:hypothetical protein
MLDCTRRLATFRGIADMSCFSRLIAIFTLSAFAVAYLGSNAPQAHGQPKAAAPVVPASYPTLTSPANLGSAPGATFETVLTGTNLTNATAIAASFPCKASIVEPTKDATKLKVKFEIPANTPIGMYSFRVATDAGSSNLRPFIVDTLPVVPEKDGNNKKDTPQVVSAPCVISGAASVEAGDFFKFKVNAGQTLTLESLGRRIGSLIDPVIILYDGTGKELPSLWADDTPGLQTDARFTHTFPTAGEFIVEIRDTTYRGGADYSYRLRIGEFAGATSAFPLAIERGKKTDIGFAGPGVEGLAKVPLTAKPDEDVVYAIPPGKFPGWPVQVRVSDNPELTEQEPNNTAMQANAIPVPGGISAKFGEKNDIDFFKFPGKKGQKVVVQALSFELNLATEVYLRILDAKGAELMKSNPQTAGVRLEYTPAADGDIFIACEQNNYASGPNEIYHLSVKPASPDFSVTLGLDRADIPAGGVGLIPIAAVTKLNGFNGPIELSFGESRMTIPASAAPTPVAPLWFPITAGKDAKPGLILGMVKATAKIDGKEVSRNASTLDIAKAALGGMPNPPVEMTSGIAVALTPAAPFTLEISFDKAEVGKGGTLKGKIKAKRSADFDADITIAAVSLPATVTAKFNPIAKGKDEADVEFTFPAGVATGPGTIVLRGTGKLKGKDTSAVALPANVTVTDTAKKEEPKKK